MVAMEFLWSFFVVSLVVAQEKIPITMVTSLPFHAESTNPYAEYYCYLNSPDADATVTSRRVWETRSNRQSVNNNPAPPSPQLLSDNRYPAGSAVYRVDLSFNRNNQSYAFGTFSCDASKDGRKDTTVSNILMNSDVLASPADRLVTQIVNTGDTDVQIEMMLFGGNRVQRWYRNGMSILTPDSASATGRGTYSIATVQKGAHEGVYEAVIDFDRQPRMQPRHGLKRLVVRSCAANHWGPPECVGVCNYCYNGGVCDDETGRCICSPGFMGDNCLTACGGNRFGYSCEFQCNYDGDDEEACSGLQFCLLDPFGCRCNSGWEDLSCDTACSEGSFGASCVQDCHCNGLCDRFTGICNGTCEAGFSGDSCQIPDVCPPGYYGRNCTEKCYCENHVPCDKMTGACQNSECVPGYTVYAGSPRCQECRGDSYGESCIQECRCAADACNKVTGECSGQCKQQWLDMFHCLAGIGSVSSSKINPNTTSDISCVTQVYTNSDDTLTVNMSREPNRVIDRGIQFVNKTRMSNTEVWRFTANDVREGEELFCLFLLQEDIVAKLSTIIMEYDLPLLNSAPTLVTATTTSLTIRWKAWDPDRDVGDPPIIAYITYYRKVVSGEWIHGTEVTPEETLEFTADNLEANTEYSLSVTVVREGMNGEGPRRSSANFRTHCDVSDAVPQNVAAHVDEITKQVNISWQIPSIMCSSGISTFLIYSKKADSNQEPRFLAKSDGDVTWITINTEDLGGGEFSFFVTMTINEESALSQGSEPVMITQQNGEKPGSSPIVVIVIVIVVIILAVICAVLLVLRYRRLKTVDTVDENLEGADYENAGVSNDHEGYCQLEKQFNDRRSKRNEGLDNNAEDSSYDPVRSPQKQLNERQSKRYEEVDAVVNTSYDPVRSPHTNTKTRSTASEYEEVPMTANRRSSNATPQDINTRLGKSDSAYEVPDNFYKDPDNYMNSPT